MKALRIVLAGALALLSALALLAWFLPARWALAALQPRLHGVRLEQVSGLLWHGHAGRVLDAGGDDLGALDWTLSRRALLGDLRLRFALDGPGRSISGAMRRLSATESAWRDVRVQADASVLDGWVVLGGQRLHGRLNVHIVDARLQGYWPMRLHGSAQWLDGAVDDAGRRVELGGFRLDADGEGGVLRLHAGDDGRGPLHADGQATLSPLGWRYALTLQPRTDDPALHRWLQRFGQPAPDGSLRLHGSGGLAKTLSRMERR
ncbi:type II secretion system protein N [Fulvimonas sp. R45]|uniref:type II secretion system protein N n=1 Tax=Fulvimonas sp. R45 TaxID=3045937 RepID=UPI00265F395E|nr:type II secretion system protein N [Fulvimonas sp. R45]MDO1529121.1 type II secretion system protein N [Fulvimonas sp. R45]